MLQHALSDLELVIQETGAVVTFEPMPVVNGDKSQLGQLFQNLLSNAIKFHHADTVPRIQVNYQIQQLSQIPLLKIPAPAARAYHRINFTDNGIGFDQKYASIIFQVFQRLNGKHEFSGSGIGLAICEKAAANHNGAITVVSKPGQGSTFSVYLPVSD